MEPKVVSTNWKKVYSPPAFEATSRNHTEKDPAEIFRFDLKDDKGPYTLFRELRRPTIDATLLRTCKTFLGIGSKILYGQNKFNFEIKVIKGVGAPPTFYGRPRGEENGEGKVEHRPSPFKPRPSNWWEEISERISQIKRQDDITSIKGWIYYDLFLRFLYKIGPRNAALLQNLKFSGIVRLHSCNEVWSCGRECPEDLV
jgi:hypothetical protein